MPLQVISIPGPVNRPIRTTVVNTGYTIPEDPERLALGVQNVGTDPTHVLWVVPGRHTRPSTSTGNPGLGGFRLAQYQSTILATRGPITLMSDTTDPVVVSGVEGTGR